LLDFKYKGKTIAAVAVGLDRYIFEGEEIYYILLIELHKSIFL